MHSAMSETGSTVTKKNKRNLVDFVISLNHTGSLVPNLAHFQNHTN